MEFSYYFTAATKANPPITVRFGSINLGVINPPCYLESLSPNMILSKENFPGPTAINTKAIAK